jgi:enolase
MGSIAKIKARQIIDSRGNPTVEVDVVLTSGVVGRAAVPSGASTGTKEALELRDQDKKYFLGKSVLKACENVDKILFPALKGKDARNQKELDLMMLELDGTEYKSKIGANAILGVSLALAKASAQAEKKSLFKYLRENLNCPTWDSQYQLPRPLMNIINGGAHASNNLDVQEFMVAPKTGKNFAENLRMGVEIFHHLKNVLSKKGFVTAVGDEGGFAPNFQNNEQALKTIVEAIEQAGYSLGKDVELSLDVAASEFYDADKKLYIFEGKEYSSLDMIQYYADLKKKYPLFSIEDGLSELDQSNWSALTSKLGKECMIIGDDLYVTNKKILDEGIKNKWSNAILVKVNQIGSLTETLETLSLAQKNGFKAIISHRSGETADSFIADLAVATSCGFIKTGSACRTDRVEKYNQLLRIEEELS